MRYTLEGNWRKGLAFDLHILASTYLGPDQFGHDQFENTRSDMGELVYQLKYKSDNSSIPKIIELLKNINGIDKFDAIIPVPSSNKNRKFQPVDEIAKALGKDRDVDVVAGFLEKKTGQELKGAASPEERKSILENAISIVSKDDLSGKTILLVDDLYGSGATLEACTAVLYEDAGVADVCVLTMTKTRRRR